MSVNLFFFIIKMFNNKIFLCRFCVQFADTVPTVCTTVPMRFLLLISNIVPNPVDSCSVYKTLFFGGGFCPPAGAYRKALSNTVQFVMHSKHFSPRLVFAGAKQSFILQLLSSFFFFFPLMCSLLTGTEIEDEVFIVFVCFLYSSWVKP